MLEFEEFLVLLSLSSDWRLVTADVRPETWSLRSTMLLSIPSIRDTMEKENMIMLDKNMNHSEGKADMSRPKAEAISATVAPFLINSFSFSVNSILWSNSLYILELF